MEASLDSYAGAYGRFHCFTGKTIRSITALFVLLFPPATAPWGFDAYSIPGTQTDAGFASDFLFCAVLAKDDSSARRAVSAF
jgi:hypothetical protein